MRYLLILSLLVNLNSYASGTIRGVVQDKISRHTLAGTNIYYIKSKTGTTSDSFGRFEIVAMQNDTLLLSFMGYKAKTIPVSELFIGERTNYIELERTILFLDELQVAADRFENEIQSLDMEPGAVRLNYKDIRMVPYFIYPDINRSLQFLPGVISTNDLTSELNVRGGSPDQNLVLLEGVPVYYPFHVFGLASAFNTDMVGEVHFSSGGFSAQYGNRLSSVLDVKTHLAQKPLELSADLSLLGADITASGRWGNKLNWIVSFRKSYYDVLLEKLGDGAPYAFYDFFSKIAYTPNKNNSYSILFFDFRDRFTESYNDQNRMYYSYDEPVDYITYSWDYEGSFYWKNRIISGIWDRRFSNNLSIRGQFYSSLAGNIFVTDRQTHFPDDAPDKYDLMIEEILAQDKLNKVKVDNDFKDIAAQLSFQWNPSSNVTLKGGVQQNRYKTNYGWGNNQLPFTPLYNYQDHIKLYFDSAPDSFDYRKTPNMQSGYSELLWTINDKYSIRAGLRVSKWSGSSKINIDPRLNFKHKLNQNWVIKTAYGRFSQGLATSLEDGLVNFLRLYFPLTDSLNMETADHYIFTMDYKSDNKTEISLTSYLKDYNGLIKAVGPDPNFIKLPGKAYGLELSAKGRLLEWKGWLSASVSRTWRLKDGLKYDTNWDQRYRLDLFASRKIGKSWSFSWAWVLYSGVPYVADYYVAAVRHVNWSQPLDQQEQELYDTIFVDVSPGKIRFPWYHRLDISLEKEFHFSKWHMNVYFAIRNLYTRRNVLYYTEPGSLSYDTKNGKYVDWYVKHPFAWLPPIPTIGLRFVI